MEVYNYNSMYIDHRYAIDRTYDYMNEQPMFDLMINIWYVNILTYH